MANRRELVVEQLHALADDLEELWKAATRDPAAERRKQRGWALLSGALGAAATIASRRALAKLWPILTGSRRLDEGRAPTRARPRARLLVGACELSPVLRAVHRFVRGTEQPLGRVVRCAGCGDSKLASARRTEERPLRSSHSTSRSVTSRRPAARSGSKMANSSPPIRNALCPAELSTKKPPTRTRQSSPAA